MRLSVGDCAPSLRGGAAHAADGLSLRGGVSHAADRRSAHVRASEARRAAALGAVLTFTALVLAAAGCSNRNTEPGPPPRPPAVTFAGQEFTSQSNGFVVSLRLDRLVYHVGDSVALSLMLRNTSGDTQHTETFNFVSPQRYDFVVRDSLAREVWRWSAGREFPYERSQLVLHTGDSTNWDAAWDMRDSVDAPLKPYSDYTLTAIPTCCRQALTLPVLAFRTGVTQ